MELVVESLVNIIAGLAIAAGVVFAGWWAMGLLSVRSREQELDRPEMDAPAGIREKLNGVPAVLTFLIVFLAVTMVSYILAVWLTGVTY